MPGPISRIRFGSVLPKKARIKLCKTGPDPMWMAWSGFCKTLPIRKLNEPPVGNNHLGLTDRYHLPTQFWFGCAAASADGHSLIVLNQPESDSVLADYQVLVKGSCSESSLARIMRPASGQRFGADMDWMRIGSDLSTGHAQTPDTDISLPVRRSHAHKRQTHLPVRSTAHTHTLNTHLHVHSPAHTYTDTHLHVLSPAHIH